MIADVLIEIVELYQKAVGGHTAPDLISCVNTGYMICSEVRHLISDEMYREFEAPYLRRLGESCGPFSIHSCGCFERTIRATAEDPNIIAADFQSKETNVALMLSETSNSLTLNIRKSFDIGEEYMWADDESYYRYLMSVIKEPSPVMFRIYNIDAYRRVRDEVDVGLSGMFRKI